MQYCLFFFFSESFFYKTEYFTTSYFMGFGMMLYQLTELPKWVFCTCFLMTYHMFAHFFGKWSKDFHLILCHLHLSISIL